MFRYIFALLLLNSSYRSLGLPLPSGVTNVSLANLLTALANSCDNHFLSSQIKSKLEYCSDLTSPRGRKLLDCWLFYDINKQLCSAVGGSKLALNEDYSAEINKLQDVSLLCETSNQWLFTNLTEFPQYKSTVENMFKHPANCGRVCSGDDVTSDDSNFYCKYFKWGADMIKVQVPRPSLSQENPVKLPLEISSENKQASNDLVDVKIKNTSTNTPSSPSAIPSSELQIDVINTNERKPEASSENNLDTKPQMVNTAAIDKLDLKKSEEPVPVESQVPIDQADKPAEITNLEDNNEKPKNSPDSTLTKPESDAQNADIQQLNNELEHKEPVIENPGQSKEKPGDSVDYQDGDEGKEGLGDIQGDDDGDDDDAIIGDNKVKLEDQKEEPSETQNLKNVVSGITGESSLYPRFGQDEYSADDDDHFFSFFLTAVIIVVLIYILYHNKNKVGKVFFGLILEGRQSGRRRNSRGHAYRRLDTLEQAMSTNSAAPPSKIIY